MKTGIGEALVLSAAMAAAIFFCRVFPFLFFRGKSGGGEPGATDEARTGQHVRRRSDAFLGFVEKTVPPVAMTVLTFNALAGPVKATPLEIIPTLAAAAFTALVHIWRRNPLISVFGGTAMYMLLIRVLN